MGIGRVSPTGNVHADSAIASNASRRRRSRARASASPTASNRTTSPGRRWARRPRSAVSLSFFGACQVATAQSSDSTRFFPGADGSYPSDFTLWQGKVTWQISPSHTFEVAGNGDPFTGILRNDYWNAAATLTALAGTPLLITWITAMLSKRHFVTGKA